MSQVSQLESLKRMQASSQDFCNSLYKAMEEATNAVAYTNAVRNMLEVAKVAQTLAPIHSNNLDIDTIAVDLVNQIEHLMFAASEISEAAIDDVKFRFDNLTPEVHNFVKLLQKLHEDPDTPE